MQPNHLDPHTPAHEANQERRLHAPRDTASSTASRETAARSQNASGGRRYRSEDSWIEVASQPSSSSLSSATANDDIITTGLRVRQQRHNRAARRASASNNVNIHYSRRSPSVPGSSQDEYEESESESDRVLSSSNEGITSRTRPDAVFIHDNNSSASEATFSSDEDDNSTALGLNPNPTVFTPQPNAFSHPPASQTQRSRTTSYFANPASTPSNRPGIRRNSRSSLRPARQARQQQHSPYNMISPSHQADNDAALRASLSTLLSCAAAARGLPKNDSQPPTTERPEPSAFRLVSESVALGEETGQERSRAAVPTFTNAQGQCHTPRSSSSKRAASPATANKARRKASPTRNRSPSSKRARRVSMAQNSPIISPTMMTWVISAGVVVLFSAISFSAGYVLGREVGHTEAAQGLGNNGLGELINGDGLSSVKAGAGCGKEAVKGGLKRLRWVGGGTGSSISA